MKFFTPDPVDTGVLWGEWEFGSGEQPKPQTPTQEEPKATSTPKPQPKSTQEPEKQTTSSSELKTSSSVVMTSTHSAASTPVISASAAPTAVNAAALGLATVVGTVQSEEIGNLAQINAVVGSFGVITVTA